MIFQFESYKSFLVEWIAKQARNGYGIKSQMAKELGVKPAFLSQVLNGEQQHLSLEQADRLIHFLQLNETEKQYLFMLVEFERAGTYSLKEYWGLELRKLQAAQQTLKNRFATETMPNREVQTIYFSSWYYSGIHLLLSSVPVFSSSKIAQRLGLPQDVVAEVIYWLEQNGFGYIENSKWVGTPINIHFPSDSHLIKKHHTHWRLKALQSIELNKLDELHYSTCFTLSNKDWVKIKEILIKSIEQTKNTIKSSGDEKLYSIGIDCFCLENV